MFACTQCVVISAIKWLDQISRKAENCSYLCSTWTKWMLTHKAPPAICSRQQFQTFSKITNKEWYFMRIVCQQTIFMTYHSLFFLKLGKISQNLLSAAVVIGALRVKINWDCIQVTFTQKVLFHIFLSKLLMEWKYFIHCRWNRNIS